VHLPLGVLAFFAFVLNRARNGKKEEEKTDTRRGENDGAATTAKRNERPLN